MSPGRQIPRQEPPKAPTRSPRAYRGLPEILEHKNGPPPLADAAARAPPNQSETWRPLSSQPWTACHLSPERQQVRPLVLKEVEKEQGVAAGTFLDVVRFGPGWPLGDNLSLGIFSHHELLCLSSPPRRVARSRSPPGRSQHHARQFRQRHGVQRPVARQVPRRDRQHDCPASLLAGR
jgi:hypothetical protein